jgi:hypothetical protein
MNYSEVWNLISGGKLITVATVACAKAAEDIRNEAATTLNHANRLAWAGNDPHGNAKAMLWALAMNATVQSRFEADYTVNPVKEATLDNDVQFVVNGLIDKFATGV